ncbi:MAG TPA: hypothetical protein VFJ16_21930 [Longimicrobium sp.]|nr:hypothetical protein [Longimicrobium sp.]
MSSVPWSCPAGPRAVRTARTRHGTRAAVRVLAACLAAAVPAVAAQAQCAPPAVPAHLLRNGARWDSLAAFMREKNVSFVGATPPETVIPCRARQASKCQPMTGTVAAESRATCITAALAGQDSARFVGMVRRVGGWNPANLGFGTPNTDGAVYLLVRGGQSLAVANWGGVVRALQQSLGNTWSFRFHAEPQTFGTSEGKWRPDSSATTGLVAMRQGPAARHGGPSALMDEDDGVGPLNYNVGALQMGDPAFAWMTCAAGCCQFHGSPPDGGGGGPEGHGGHGGHGGGHPRPERRR